MKTPVYVAGAVMAAALWYGARTPEEVPYEVDFEIGDPTVESLPVPYAVFTPKKRSKQDYVLASNRLETIVQKESLNFQGPLYVFPFISPISPEDKPLPWKQYQWNKAREKEDEEGNMRMVFHKAADIPVQNGTPVYAPADGKVTTLFYNDKGKQRSAGWTLEIEHDTITIDGKTPKSAFLHLGIPYRLPKGKTTVNFNEDFDPLKYKIFAKKGDMVKKGQLIACSGNTGTHDEHLHAELYKGKERIDPRPLYIHTQAMIDEPQRYYFRASEKHSCD